jgi:hypothetical protein
VPPRDVRYAVCQHHDREAERQACRHHLYRGGSEGDQIFLFL